MIGEKVLRRCTGASKPHTWSCVQAHGAWYYSRSAPTCVRPTPETLRVLNAVAQEPKTLLASQVQGGTLSSGLPLLGCVCECAKQLVR